MNRQLNVHFYLWAVTFFLAYMPLRAQNWQWVQGPVNVSNSSGSGEAVTTDKFGNVYATGVFSGSSITFGSTTLYNSGPNYDGYILKYSSSGHLIWATNIQGGYSNVVPYAICTDLTGNVFVTGWFNGSQLYLGSTYLTGYNSSDMFLAKYDSSGAPVWGANIRGSMSGGSNGKGVRADAAGNIYVSGSTVATTIGNPPNSVNNMGSDDVFLAKYAPNGNQIWARTIGGRLNDANQAGLGMDQFENLYIVGQTTSDSLYSGSALMLVLTPNTSNPFVAKFTSSGNPVWVRGGTGPTSTLNWGICTDYHGNTSISGSFSGASLTFGSTVLSNPIPSHYDIYRARYDANGNLKWAAHSAQSHFFPQSMTADREGNSYTCGLVDSIYCVGPDTIISAGQGDILLFKYDSLNNFVMAKRVGGPYGDSPIGIYADSLSNLFLTGYIGHPYVVFGQDTLTCNHTNPLYDTFPYIAKYLQSLVTGIKEFQEKDDVLTIYPNPTDGDLTLSLKPGTTLSQVSVFDNQGRKVLGRELRDSSSSLNLHGLPPGFYFLWIHTTSEKIYHRKIVLSK